LDFEHWASTAFFRTNENRMRDEPSLKTRREFLRVTTLGGALTWTIPSFLSHTFTALHAEAADRATQTVTGRDAAVLVILQMAGGNDGLNTVVPFANDHYQKARPKLGLPGKAVLKINDQLGFHPSLAAFKALYEQGQLGVVQGVGYPNPNRSHFRSTDIWQTASDANKFERYGWIGRYFDNACSGCDPITGVNVGRQMPLAFAAKRPVGVSLESPQSYRFITSDTPEADEQAMMEESYRKLNRPDPMLEDDENAGGSIGAVAGSRPHTGSTLDFLERTALDAQLSSDKIRSVTSKVQNQAIYPNGPLANALKLVARLIGGRLPTRVYYVSQGGYDTHTNQAGAQERLLRELGDAVKAFLDDVKAQGNLERVLLMTFSEFGRRLAENASGGTDHGAASALFLAGGKVKAGLLGAYPSLTPRDLLNGDPKFTTDFRCVYAGVLEHWLKTPSVAILGRPFAPLPVVASAPPL
jgi:uncharacterized protein (DUF1501 family)